MSMKETYIKDIIKYLESEIKELQNKKKKTFCFSKKDEERLKKLEKELLSKYEKLGNFID